MSSPLKFILRLAIVFPTIGVGFAWILTHPQHSLFFKLGFLFVGLGLLLIWQIGKKYTNIIFSLSILLWTYPLGELTLYFQSPATTITGYNKPFAELDSIRGFRYTARNVRYFKIAESKTVFDNQFTTNKQGWVMDQDYHFKKSNPTKKRWLLFGDSFSAGIMLKKNLPNRMQEAMDQDSTWNAEIYSFAIDGGGLANWHQTFFNEVVPNYEFDGVILAIFGDDLYRDFFIQEGLQKNGFLGRIRIEDWPIDTSRLNQYNIQQMRLQYSDSEIDDLKASPPKKEFDWPLKTLLTRKLNSPKKIRRDKKISKNLNELRESLGERKYQMLESMISWCKQHKKDIILTSIPPRNLDQQASEEVQIIANHWNLEFLNGNEVFASEDQIKKYWLANDGHWNQLGSDLYSDFLIKIINKGN